MTMNKYCFFNGDRKKVLLKGVPIVIVMYDVYFFNICNQHSHKRIEQYVNMRLELAASSEFGSLYMVLGYR